MPASTRGVKRPDTTFVLVSEFLAYGWASANIAALPGISEAELTTSLGHMREGAMFTGYVRVMGANAPKPLRVKKRIPNPQVGTRGSVSTFCGYDKFPAAQVAGWRFAKAPGRVTVSPPRAGSRTFTGVVVLSNSEWYAQPIDSIAATSEVQETLGILVASGITANGRKLLVRGSKSKPGIARVTLPGGGVAQLPFSAARRTNVLAAGYEVIKDESIFYTTDVVPF